MHRGGHREHVRSVAGEADHRFIRTGQLHADRRTTVPAERTCPTGEARTRFGTPDVIVDRRKIGDAFIEDDRFTIDLAAHAVRPILGGHFAGHCRQRGQQADQACTHTQHHSTPTDATSLLGLGPVFKVQNDYA